MLLSTIAFLSPLWLIYGLLSLRRRDHLTLDRQNPNVKFFFMLFAVFFACLAVMVLTGKVAKVKDRWLQPILFAAPLAFFIALPNMSQATVYKRIIQVAAGFALTILFVLPARVYLTPVLGKYIPSFKHKGGGTQQPFPQLAAELTKRFPEVRTQIVGDKHTAGNLYFNRPNVKTLLLDEIAQTPPPLRGEVLLVMRSDKTAGGLERFQKIYPACTVRKEGKLVLSNQFGSTGTMSFDYALVKMERL